MKTTIKFVLIMFAAVLGVACNDIIENTSANSSLEKEIVLTATREGVASGTKSFRLDDGSVWWSPAEEVSVFYGSGSNGGSKFVSMNTAIAETVELQGSVQMSGSGKNFWAVYPYSEENSCDGNSITTEIPDRQTGVEGNFSNDTFPTVAKSSSLSLAFWNICGGIKFFVSRSDIKSVTFKGNNNEPLAGKVNVSFSSDGEPYVSEVIDAKAEVTLNAPDGAFKVGKYYYFTLLPISLKNGFTMTFETAEMRGSVVSEKTLTVKRSVFGVLKNVDSKVSEWESTVKVEPEWVDLGLSVKWATFNVGATKPEEYGDYFAWGETEPKDEFSWSNYKWCNGAYNKLTKYCPKKQSTSWDGGEEPDGLSQLEFEDDAANVNWGDNWRIPMDSEWKELIDNCSCIWTEENGVYGYKVTSNKVGYEGNSIFLPATGYYSDWSEGLKDAGSNGKYWSSRLYDYDVLVQNVYFNYKGIGLDRDDRLLGCPVRAVYDGRKAILELDRVSRTLYEGQSTVLALTVLLDKRANKTVTWETTNPKVASVDENGKVEAKSPGVAVVSVISNEGELSAHCSVTVLKNTKPECVELGLSVKWATFNVGASKPEEYGGSFAWGETELKDNYSISNYKWCNGALNKLTKYCRKSEYEYWDGDGQPDGLTQLDLTDDAAFAILGDTWRMPTDAEWTELKNNCTWKYTSNYNGTGVRGRIVTSNKSGYTDKSIFLPDTEYWTSSLCCDYLAYCSYLGSVRNLTRDYGRPVRPVTE